MERYTVGEVLPEKDIEALAKLFYKLGGQALNDEAIDRLIDNPNIVLGDN